jgi:hypothetical protein
MARLTKRTPTMAKHIMPDGRPWHDVEYRPAYGYYIRGRRLKSIEIIKMTEVTASAITSRMKRYDLTADEAFNCPPTKHDRMQGVEIVAWLKIYRPWLATIRPPKTTPSARDIDIAQATETVRALQTYRNRPEIIPPQPQSLKVEVQSVDPKKLDAILAEVQALNTTMVAILDHLTRPRPTWPDDKEEPEEAPVGRA